MATSNVYGVHAGVIMSCVGPTQIAYQLLIYPSLVQKWGVKWLFVVGVAGHFII